MEVLAGTDFFTVEVFTLKGLVTYYVLFFIQLETRRVCLAGITPYPDQEWMEQQARNVTMKDWGFLATSRYLLHDRDGKFCPVFREVMQAGKVKPLKLPARSPNLNAYVSYCTSFEHCGRSGAFGRRRHSLTPCAFLGMSGPTGSYRCSGLSV